MPALNSGRYHIKWTQLANLPAPMHSTYATVQNKKVYVAGGLSPVNDVKNQVYVYDMNTDHWDQLPPPGLHYGVLHIIGGKLAIIGGRLSAIYDSEMATNKVSTFDEISQNWTSYYPDLLSVRFRPGVVTHLEHVIVAGGGKFVNHTWVVQDDIEVLNWMKNSHWQKVSINLPAPMAYFTPIITDDHLLIVGYDNANNRRVRNAYEIPVDDITRSGDQQQTIDTSTKWITMTNDTHWRTALVPSSSLSVVVGGEDQSGTPTSAIKMYDDSSNSWKNISSLSSARSRVAIAAVNNNAILVIGGYTKGGSGDNRNSSSVAMVELGQAQLI